MGWHVHFVGRGGLAVFVPDTLDIALWDLMRPGTGCSAAAHSPSPPMPAALTCTLDELQRQTGGCLAQGFQAIKMKVGRPRLAEDGTRVTALRQHLGADFPLRVDANMQQDPDAAMAAAQALAPLNVDWREEPVIPDASAEPARIAREGGLPVTSGC